MGLPAYSSRAFLSASGSDSSALPSGIVMPWMPSWFSSVNVPNFAPAPVPGNHGQYVSGASHAGIKGKALAEIAKDGSLVGPYDGRFGPA